MNIQQLRAVREAVRHDFNLADVALALGSSQALLSRQIRGLEDELGVDLFVRAGERLVGMTGVGKTVLPLLELVLQDVESVRRVVGEWRTPHEGTLSVGVTHTHARYLLPQVVRDFRNRYPLVSLQLRQESSDRIAEMLRNDELDIGIAADQLAACPQIVAVPCFRHSSVIVVPHGHPLGAIGRPLTLHDLAPHPLVTYEAGVLGRQPLEEAFQRANLTPNIALAGIAADVIKTYVELGLGVGVIASLAWDEVRDSHRLRMLDASHLFPANTTHIGWKRGTRLSDAVSAFINTFAPASMAEVMQRPPVGV
jgi:LysR family transcriptional regulator, cys regulon transcriptional activator